MEMDKSTRTGGSAVARLLLFGIFVLVVRFVYVVTVHGESCVSVDFCFFTSSSHATAAVSAAFVDHDGHDVDAAAAVDREWRKAVSFYSAAFQDLVMEGFLSPASNSLSLGSPTGYEVLALREIGVSDAVGIGRKKSPPLVVAGDPLRLPFANDTFDFVFSGVGVLESSKWPPAHLASELARALKPGWFLVAHTSSAGDSYSLNSFLALFPSCKLVKSREMEGLDSTPIREIVLQKEDSEQHQKKKRNGHSAGGNLGGSNKCSMLDHKLKLVKSAEPLIEEEPLKPWITLKRNAQNIKYLPAMVDISFKNRYVYIDVGARSYGSSIGSWFRKQYPKQNHTFEVYAIEADRAFHDEYATKKGINLLPFAAWVRNETLSFEINHDPDNHKNEGQARGMGRIRPASGSLSSGDVHVIQGFDFAKWLKTAVAKTDFVVVKMDVEGTEFDLIPRLFETGAICLVDELFLECHYNRWQRCCPGERTPKYQNTYEQCLQLFSSLRKTGVLVHQWW